MTDFELNKVIAKVRGDDHESTVSTDSSIEHVLVVDANPMYLKPPVEAVYYEFKERPAPPWSRFQNNFNRKKRR